MLTKPKIFVASSFELKDDRDALELFIGRKNKNWVDKGVFLELVMWEDFIDAMSKTRLQDKYNEAIQECDIFVMLFCTKVGQFTAEEFATAFKQFKSTNKPFIYTYFKDAAISTGSANQQDLMSLWTFQAKLTELGHFQTPYQNTDGLLLHFSDQLDKLAAAGFMEFKPDTSTCVEGGAINVSNSTGVVIGSAVNTGGGDFIAGNYNQK